jgi:hypothetical protein
MSPVNDPWTTPDKDAPKWSKEVVSFRVRTILDVMVEHHKRYEGLEPLQVLMRVRDNVEAWLHEDDDE